MAFGELLKIFLSAVSATQPAQLITKKVSFNEASNSLHILDSIYDLTNKDIVVVGAGKAVYHMAQSLIDIVGRRIKMGILSVPKGSLANDLKGKGPIKFLEGAKNNLPDSDAISTACEIRDLVSSLRGNTLLIVLLSGGGSALLPLPLAPITLDEKLSVIRDLVCCGASINELNIIRKKLSALKGGKLANLAKNTDIVTLILSDIVGDPIDLIASGPTVEDLDEMKVAIEIIQKYELTNKLPLSVHSVLFDDNTIKTERKPNDTNRVFNYVVGNNALAIESARIVALGMGYDALVISDSVQGDVNIVASAYMNIINLLCQRHLEGHNNTLETRMSSLLKSLASKEEYMNGVLTYMNGKFFQQTICLIAGGEPTVKISGSGRGGRNQELALRLSVLLNNNNQSSSKSFKNEVMCAGTDGIDGPTDAAGAYGYSSLVDDAIRENLNPEEYIRNNDSYTFYNQFRNGDCHIKIGHTQTNVMDIHIIIIKKNEQDFLIR